MKIDYRISCPVESREIDALGVAAPKVSPEPHWDQVLSRSLGWICAYEGERLVGFVNIAWDGGDHAFVLDTRVHLDVQRRGIGREVVRRAADLARSRGVEWLHVDFEPELKAFYEACGFRSTDAGLLHLRQA